MVEVDVDTILDSLCYASRHSFFTYGVLDTVIFVISDFDFP